MRLTKEIRENIINKAMAQAFDEREKAHEAAATALADALYQHQFSEAEKIAKKLPAGWCASSSYIKIESGGFSYRSHRDGLMPDQLKMSKERFVPHGSYHREIKVGGDHPLNDQAQSVAEEHRALKHDKEALLVKLQALVNSATTAKKLREIWPECETFLPASATAVTMALVPVEMVAEVNKMLGI